MHDRSVGLWRDVCDFIKKSPKVTTTSACHSRRRLHHTRALILASPCHVMSCDVGREIGVFRTTPIIEKDFDIIELYS
jgi:hypothetical protein